MLLTPGDYYELISGKYFRYLLHLDWFETDCGTNSLQFNKLSISSKQYYKLGSNNYEETFK